MEICKDTDCTVFKTLQLIGGKWVLIILSHLMNGTKRFGELKNTIPGISPKSLTQQLRKLEEEGLVERKMYPEIPPKVEYSLTKKGQDLEPVYHQIINWGMKYS